MLKRPLSARRFVWVNSGGSKASAHKVSEFDSHAQLSLSFSVSLVSYPLKEISLPLIEIGESNLFLLLIPILILLLLLGGPAGRIHPESLRMQRQCSQHRGENRKCTKFKFFHSVFTFSGLLWQVGSLTIHERPRRRYSAMKIYVQKSCLPSFMRLLRHVFHVMSQ